MISPETLSGGEQRLIPRKVLHAPVEISRLRKYCTAKDAQKVSVLVNVQHSSYVPLGIHQREFDSARTSLKPAFVSSKFFYLFPHYSD